MKRFMTLALVAIATLTATAQTYRGSSYYNRDTDRLDYSKRENPMGTGSMYYGFRIGPTFSTVNSDDANLDGGDSQTGLTLGAVVGFQLSDDIPLYLESGLSYTEKGGKKTLTGKKMTYDLNYLELPILIKYIYDIDGHFSVQPLFGGYLSYGISGKIKNFGERQAQDSFSDMAFKRFDGGLRIGCGVGYDLFYADLSYDIGLSNICHDTFDTSHNGCLYLNFGVNF